MVAHPGALVLGYHGQAAGVWVRVSINDQTTYTFDADMASSHFAGGHESVVRCLKEEVVRAFRESTIDSVEKLRVEAAVNGQSIGAREAHMYPNMREQDQLDLAAELGDWLGRHLLSGVPIGEATPLYQRTGDFVV